MVVGVSDGDTIKARCSTNSGLQTISVRLAEIDAPEKGQAFAQRSKQHLARICFGLAAEIRPSAVDRYGRAVARVSCSGADANAAMVNAGMAWAYTQYLHDPRIKALETSARQRRVGLWADDEPIAPWVWRQAKAAERSGARAVL